MTGVMTMACGHGFVSQPGMAILASASNVMTNVGMVRISAMTRRLPRWSVGCPSMSDVDSPSAVTLPSIVTPPSMLKSAEREMHHEEANRRQAESERKLQEQSKVLSALMSIGVGDHYGRCSNPWHTHGSSKA